MIVGSNLTRACMCVGASSTGRGLSTGRILVEGILTNVYKQDSETRKTECLGQPPQSSHAVGRAVRRRLVSMEARVRYRACQFGICGGRCSTGTGMSLSIYIFRWQRHSSSAPHWHSIPVSPTLCTLNK
jgi:hypothetical protein